MFLCVKKITEGLSPTLSSSFPVPVSLSLYFFLTPLLLIKDSRVSLKDVSEADLNGIYNNLFTVLITHLQLMKRYQVDL